MGLKKPPAPTAPDPYQTADAQSAANLKAIHESAKLSAVDSHGPTGSTTYQRDANGDPISQTVSLSPGEDQYYNAQTGLKNALLGNVPTGAFTNPGSDRGSVEKALYDRAMGLIQPGLDQDAKVSNVRLGERGIPIGSEIYNDEQSRMAANSEHARTGAANDAVIGGGQEQSRQLQDALTTYNQPFNAWASVAGGSPIGAPQPQSNPAYQVAAPDLAGMIYSNYGNAANQYNQSRSSALNGLFGLGSAALGAFL